MACVFFFLQEKKTRKEEGKTDLDGCTGLTPQLFDGLGDTASTQVHFEETQAQRSRHDEHDQMDKRLADRGHVVMQNVLYEEVGDKAIRKGKEEKRARSKDK